MVSMTFLKHVCISRKARRVDKRVSGCVGGKDDAKSKSFKNDKYQQPVVKGKR